MPSLCTSAPHGTPCVCIAGQVERPTVPGTENENAAVGDREEALAR